MSFGVPAEWVDDVRDATEDTLFEVIGLLPQEAQEALLKLAVGEKPEPSGADTGRGQMASPILTLSAASVY